jgi:hypothetical protein
MVSANEYSCAKRAQINSILTPYLTYTMCNVKTSEVMLKYYFSRHTFERKIAQ